MRVSREQLLLIDCIANYISFIKFHFEARNFEEIHSFCLL